MPAWKVLFIGVLGFACLALATAAFVVPFSFDDGQKWLWLVVLVAANAVTAGLLVLFLRHVSARMDLKPRRTH